MVIECPGCQTRFKIADEKVMPGGTKVRCSKCKQIFTVMPPEPPPMTPPAEEEVDFGDFNMERVPEAGPPPAAPSEAISSATAWDGSAGTGDSDDFSLGQSEEDQEGFSFSGGKETPETDRFTLGEERKGNDGPEDSDEFDFGDEKAGSDPFGFGEKEETKINSEAFGFEESGDFSLGEEEEPDGEKVGPDEFGFEESDSFGPSEFAFEDEDTGAGEGSEFSWDTEEGSPEAGKLDFGQEDGKMAEEDEFDFSGMSFGEDEVAQTGAALAGEDPASRQAQPAIQEESVLLSPQEPATQKVSAGAPMEHPPIFSASPRRRKSPLQGLIYFIILLLLAITGGAVYLYWQGDIPELTRFVDRLTGQTAPPQTGGQIRLEELSSFYVNNREVGQMLVIQGKAVNDYPNARSSLAVKGILYDKDGKALLQQTVFCGNPLDRDMLPKLPYVKIEESMNNPFGESLSNLNVAPGKVIPFTIVFRNLPANIAEFTVEAADSKPGTKQ